MNSYCEYPIAQRQVEPPAMTMWLPTSQPWMPWDQKERESCKALANWKCVLESAPFYPTLEAAIHSRRNSHYSEILVYTLDYLTTNYQIHIPKHNQKTIPHMLKPFSMYFSWSLYAVWNLKNVRCDQPREIWKTPPCPVNAFVEV